MCQTNGLEKHETFQPLASTIKNIVYENRYVIEYDLFSIYMYDMKRKSGQRHEFKGNVKFAEFIDKYTLLVCWDPINDDENHHEENNELLNDDVEMFSLIDIKTNKQIGVDIPTNISHKNYRLSKKRGIFRKHLLYFTGFHFIVFFNILTGQEVFRVPLPDAINIREDSWNLYFDEHALKLYILCEERKLDMNYKTDIVLFECNLVFTKEFEKVIYNNQFI